MEVIIKEDHLVYKNAMGEYHISAELAVEKGLDLEAFVIAEIKLKASQNQYVKATVSFDDARDLGFCEHGISDFCDQLGIDQSKTYNLLELQEKLTLKVMFDYVDEMLTLFGKSAFKGFETEISKDDWYSYYYAKDVLKGRFEMGEDAISKDARYSYLYAIDVFKGRFKTGEKAISKSASYSCYYAEYVLKGRFEVGEKAISKDAYYSYCYAEDVLKGRFEMGEKVISKHAKYSCYYAIYALKGRFEMGEDAIYKHAYCSKEYNDFVNNLN